MAPRWRLSREMARHAKMVLHLAVDEIAARFAAPKADGLPVSLDPKRR